MLEKGQRISDHAQLRQPADAQPALTRRIVSRELLGPDGQIIIHHRGEDYRLRITSKGKLLLTK